MYNALCVFSVAPQVGCMAFEFCAAIWTNLLDLTVRSATKCTWCGRASHHGVERTGVELLSKHVAKEDNWWDILNSLSVTKLCFLTDKDPPGSKHLTNCPSLPHVCSTTTEVQAALLVVKDSMMRNPNICLSWPWRYVVVGMFAKAWLW